MSVTKEGATHENLIGSWITKAKRNYPCGICHTQIDKEVKRYVMKDKHICLNCLERQAAVYYILYRYYRLGNATKRQVRTGGGGEIE